jgi:hypothetical protein
MNFDGSVSGSYQKGLGMNRFKNKPSRCPIGSAGPSPIPFFDLGRPLRFGLCVADSFGEHVAKFSLRLRWFSRVGFLPLSHSEYVGITESESKPQSCQSSNAINDFLASLTPLQPLYNLIVHTGRPWTPTIGQEEA